MDIKKLFGAAKTGVSRVTEVSGFSFAVLPEYIRSKFSSYNLGDDNDFKKVKEYYDTQGITKTYACSLCHISEEDNIVEYIDEEGKHISRLYINKETPSTEINEQYKADKYTFNITGTISNYYNPHLLMSTADHIPTYCLFLWKDLFSEMMEAINYFSKQEPSTVGYFNGSFGSDQGHAHIHLTEGKQNHLVEKIKKKSEKAPDGIYPYTDGKVKTTVFLFSKVEDLFKNVAPYVYNYVENIRQNNTDYTLTASLFFYAGKYYVCLTYAIRYAKVLNGSCKTVLFPAPAMLKANDVSGLRGKDKGVKCAESLIKDMPESTYLHVSEIAEFKKPVDFGKIAKTITEAKLEEALSDAFKHSPEYLWVVCELHKETFKNSDNISLLNTLFSKNCYEKQLCDYLYEIKFFLLLGVLLKHIPLKTLSKPEYARYRLSANYKNINTFGNVSSKYMYYKGDFVQKLVANSIKNFLEITKTGNRARNLVTTIQTLTINEWVNYNFKRIGAASVSGINTISTLRHLEKIDFLLKYTNPSSQAHLQDEFDHELNVGLKVNELRKKVPNYMLTYGGFNCEGNPYDGLCLGPHGASGNYLIIEKVDNPLSAMDVTSKNSNSKEIIHICAQLLAGLAFGYRDIDFTHYDLHFNNVLLQKIDRKQLKIGDNKSTHFMYEYNNLKYYMRADYLVVIIDYGLSYAKGLKKRYKQEKDRAKFSNIHKPNSGSAVYTFFYSLFIQIENTIKNLKIQGKHKQADEFIKAMNNLLIIWYECFKDYFKQNVYELMLTNVPFEVAVSLSIKDNLVIKDLPTTMHHYLNPKFIPKENIPEKMFKMIYNRGLINNFTEAAVANSNHLFRWGDIINDREKGYQTRK